MSSQLQVGVAAGGANALWAELFCAVGAPQDHKFSTTSPAVTCLILAGSSG